MNDNYQSRYTFYADREIAAGTDGQDRHRPLYPYRLPLQVIKKLSFLYRKGVIRRSNVFHVNEP
jgi:hypothetical protein